eukprot:m.115882 g.115882  ORF g.115882 m.115882 type:complete len:162 (+) comp10896_c0_seq1:197-682(+)
MVRRDSIHGDGVRYSEGPSVPPWPVLAVLSVAGGIVLTCVVTLVRHTLVLVAACAMVLAVVCTIVESVTAVDSLALLPSIGVQLERHTLLSSRKQVVPASQLIGVVIHETFCWYGVKDCLVVLVGQPGMVPEVTIPVFPTHRIALTELVPIYQESAKMFPP